MAANVNVNGVNTELIKKIFQSFVRLAVKMKNKDNKESKKTQIIKSYSVVKEFVIIKICWFIKQIIVQLDIIKSAMIT